MKDIYFVENAAEKISELIKPRQKVAVVTDDRVISIVGAFIERPHTFVFPHGEKSKNLQTYGKILEFLAENKFSRTDLVVAVGGGVVGDMTGFAAATYLRGIPYIQVPTTLLAMVDSSVGGKTAVNLGAGKNLAGAFYRPQAVIIDANFLKTLPETEIQNGMGEIIKYGAIADAGLFESAPRAYMRDTIEKCLKIKTKIVEDDEFDNGGRQLLNFGHTLGHVIEKHSNYKINHGKAVGIGMVLITEFAEERGLSKPGTAEKIKKVLEKFNMPANYSLSAKELFKLVANDKKVRGEKITLALVEEIGKGYLKDFNLEEFL